MCEGVSENVLKLINYRGGDTTFEYSETHRMKYFKKMNFMLCELFINRALLKN